MEGWGWGCKGAGWVVGVGWGCRGGGWVVGVGWGAVVLIAVGPLLVPGG